MGDHQSKYEDELKMCSECKGIVLKKYFWKHRQECEATNMTNVLPVKTVVVS